MQDVCVVSIKAEIFSFFKKNIAKSYSLIDFKYLCAIVIKIVNKTEQVSLIRISVQCLLSVVNGLMKRLTLVLLCVK